MVNLILCGGSGTRLWPLSRQMFPKQFVSLVNNSSLFQETVKRNAVLCDKFCIVTNKDHQFLAEHQIDESDVHGCRFSYLLEPVGRNTAPAIALACLDFDPEEIIFVTPSDHLIHNLAAYREKVAIACDAARKNRLVTFGIRPEYPETGYGYIESDPSLVDGVDSLHKARSFKEKPDKANAEKYCAAGNYFWNGGMFVFKAGVFLDELKKYSPAIYEQSVIAYKNACNDNSSGGARTVKIDFADMTNIPADSIDYAVMEKSDNVYIVASDIGWNDLGSFDSIDDIKEKDANGNTAADNMITIGAKNNLIFSAHRKLALVGVEDLILVDTADALCVIKKGHSQCVKDVVNTLQKGTVSDKEMTIVHSTVHRPWGTYTVLEESANYKIKKILVKPGKRLSLQKHLHRSEHWVVVVGTATVQVGECEKLVRRNESIYIPIGECHRLTNHGKIDLIIIETQVGEYLGEDDIIRVEDDYKRCQ